jgi:hypothetical protein
MERFIVKAGDLPYFGESLHFHEPNPELKLIPDVLRDFSEILMGRSTDVYLGDAHNRQYPMLGYYAMIFPLHFGRLTS